MRRVMYLVLMAVTLLGGVAAGLSRYPGLIGAGPSEISATGNRLDSSNKGLTKRVSILLIGADQRPGQIKYNTDSLILATIDPAAQRISLLSIPRDTLIALPGHGSVKINAVAALTNLSALQNSVQGLTGEPVEGYVQTNFPGFKKVIDTLGGITVDVEKNMYYETGDREDGYINLHQGLQRLNGAQALQYARFRHDALADISRTARQQIVLKAVAGEMFQLSTLTKLPVLIPQLLSAVQTNLSAPEILALAKVAISFPQAHVIAQTLPGSFLDLDGVSYWMVDPLEARKVLTNLFQGVTTDQVIDGENVDLLKPTAATSSRPLPKVPGNSQDPNGRKSSGYQIFKPKRFILEGQK